MTDFQTIDQVEQALRQLVPTAFTATRDYKLDRMTALLAAIGNPERSLKVVHVAGTSGKTSTGYYAAAALTAASYKTGLTVSPHVDSLTERVQINGQPLPDGQFCDLFAEFWPMVSRLEQPPSYFECLVAFAYWVFVREKVDYAVIEVGLGGRKDATNVMEPLDKTCIITDIGLDHTEILGDSLADIAGEKAGIIKPGNQVFTYRQAPEIMAVIERVAADQSAPLTVIEPQPPIGELPVFQQRNMYLAVAAVNHILSANGQPPLSAEQLSAVAAVTVPSRMEMLNIGRKNLILDGAHNGQKMAALVDSLTAKYFDQPMAVLAAFAEAPNRRAYEALDALLTVADTIILTSFTAQQDAHKVSIEPAKLWDYIRSKSAVQVLIEPDPAQAFDRLLRSAPSLLLVTGSFYLMNDIRPLIRRLN